MSEKTTPSCTIKTLDESLMIQAAAKASAINPANAPSLQGLMTFAPNVVITPMRLSVMTTKYWGSKGVRLTVGFLDNPAADLRAKILLHMNAWGKWSNVRFSETNVNPQVRIARTAGLGYWSYLGTDVLHIPANLPTMNLDSFTINTPDSEFYRVVRHETGHTLGFPHEHMRAEIISRIDQEKAISYFMSTQGWTRNDVIAQVLTPMDNSALIATAKPDSTSIMCYGLPGTIMKDGVAVPGGLNINSLDAQFAARVYPGPISPSSILPNDKAYFFKQAQYCRYDSLSNKVDAGYPKPIAGNWPGFPASFAAGVSSAVVWGDGKIYFFKGSEYLRYDIALNAVDAGYPKPIAGNWPLLPAKFTSGIDAAVVWNNGKAYFFKGSEYVRYDIATDKADPGYPRLIQGSWPGLPANFVTGINAVVLWTNNKAYFFKGSEYVRFDLAGNKVDPGYPKPIQGSWPGLWTSDIDA